MIVLKALRPAADSNRTHTQVCQPTLGLFTILVPLKALQKNLNLILDECVNMELRKA